MRKITIVMLIISMILVISGCEQPNYEGTHIEEQHEKPVLHTQDIDVEITSISKTHRYLTLPMSKDRGFLST